ncbi:MAG: glycosyltransferase family 39 protein [Gemmatimonadota bacterium]
MPDRAAEWARRIQWAAVLIGSLIRLRQYLHARSLWIDEAMLANNILSRSFRQLLQPLDTDQTAPVPLLWFSKLFAMWFSPDERALRLLPFLGGIVLLIALRKTAHRLLPPWPAALAVLIAALSPMLIYYANELKPYGLDAMWATLVLLLALRVRERPGDRSRWLGLLLAGMVATVATTPAPFVLAGAGIGLALDDGVRRSRGGWTWLTTCAVLWATVFATVYLLLYKSTAQSVYMQHYWVPYFLSPSLPELEAKIDHAVGSGLQDWFLSDGGRWRVEVGFLLIVPTVVGAVELGGRHGRSVAAMLLIPFGLAVFASTMRRYPVAPRLMLFGMPSMTIMLSAGIWAIGEQLYARARLPWFAMAFVALLALPGLDAVRQWAVPLDRETLRPLVATIEREHLPDAAVYVYGRAMPAWLYYTTDWSRPDLTRVHERSVLIGSTGGAFYHDASRGRPVAEEGDSLVFPFRDWRELVGVPAGLGPDTLGIRRDAPDPGWAANEVRRIRQAGGPEAWLVLFSFVPGVEDSLEAAMQATGAKQTLRDERDGAVIERYVFE